MLDHLDWTEHHGVTSLAGSLAPPYARLRQKNLAQVHLSGSRDRIAPCALAEAFVVRLGQAPPRQC